MPGGIPEDRGFDAFFCIPDIQLVYTPSKRDSEATQHRKKHGIAPDLLG